MKGNILMVDDAADIRELLANILRNSYAVTEADSGAALKQAFQEQQPDVVLLDIRLPDADGLDLLPQIKKQWPETEVIVLTGNATFEAAVEATKRGAYHFLNKPFDPQGLLVTVERALEHKQQSEENSTLRRALSTMSGGTSPVFQSLVMQTVVRTVERVAPSDVSILITGESGTGKEVIADLIHALSPRSKGKIIKINCAALPRELIESELFGSVKGAFTGAHTDREGLFRQAEGGTLFLDEISEMPVDTQSKLLRVLQDQEVRPVGGKVSYKTNCRIVAATNRKPRKPSRMASSGKISSTASAPSPFICRRCASVVKTSCPWQTPSSNASSPRPTAPSADSPRKRWTASPPSNGPAMCASCKTRFSAPSCCARGETSTPPTCPSPACRRTPKAFRTPISPCWKASNAMPSSKC